MSLDEQDKKEDTPFVCPKCGDIHGQYCNNRKPNTKHHCFKCGADWTILDKTTSTIPKEIKDMELIEMKEPQEEEQKQLSPTEYPDMFEMR